MITSRTQTGPVPGAVAFAYKAQWLTEAITVNGANPVAYTYDDDALVTGAGSLTIARQPQNGLVTGSQLGSVTDAWTYNAFGEATGYTASSGGPGAYQVAWTRDVNGRITQSIETIGGVTTTYVYAYDVAGRLSEVRQNGAVIGAYTYDGNGNRLTANGVTNTFDAQDRLTQAGTTQFTGGTFTFVLYAPSAIVEATVSVVGLSAHLPYIRQPRPQPQFHVLQPPFRRLVIPGQRGIAVMNQAQPHIGSRLPRLLVQPANLAHVGAVWANAHQHPPIVQFLEQQVDKRPVARRDGAESQPGMPITVGREWRAKEDNIKVEELAHHGRIQCIPGQASYPVRPVQRHHRRTEVQATIARRL